MARALNLMNDDEPFFGHRACAGCGVSLAVRAALKVLGERAIAILPAGCMSAAGFDFPQLAFGCNAMTSTFAGTASLMSGVAAGMRRRGEDNFTVVGFAGYGATADAGIQSLSGAIERGDDILYICYDNEATLPLKKDMFRIVRAMGAPYVATASVGYLDDYATKVAKASQIRGTKYIHVLAPCPAGWGSAVDATIELAREAVDSGLWILEESEGDEVSVGRDPRSANGGFSDVRGYLMAQRRFSHMSDAQVARVEAHRDAAWERLDRLR